MRETNNDILKNPRYLTKSKITRKELNKMGIPKSVSLKQAREDFDNCPVSSIELVGNPYNENQQRHVKVVSKQALYRQIIYGYSRKKK